MSSNLQSLKKAPRKVLNGGRTPIYSSPSPDLGEVLSSKESDYFDDIVNRAKSRLTDEKRKDDSTKDLLDDLARSHSRKDTGTPNVRSRIELPARSHLDGEGQDLPQPPGLFRRRKANGDDEPSDPFGIPSSSSSKQTLPSDMTLMSTMITRINQLERYVELLKRENHEKDRELGELRETCASLKLKKRGQGRTLREDTGEEGGEVTRLKQQISDMEDFLTDYGLIWVGKKPASPGIWSQEDSIPAREPETPDFNFVVNFDQIVSNIRDLNALAGEDAAKVEMTGKGAVLRRPNSIDLTLYANGIMLFDGPFRPYTDVKTMQCVQDLMDGYFPSELQTRYPEGVPFRVFDQRERAYSMKSKLKVFGGSGDILSSGIGSRPTHDFSKDTRVVSASRRVRHTKSVEQFLQSIPATVVKNGNLVPVRSDIEQTLNGGRQSPKRTAQVERKQDNELNLCEIKVGLLDGTDVLLKMKKEDKIADIKQIIHLEDDFDLVFGFPPTTLKDSLTLKEEGLVPKALIRVKRKNPQKKPVNSPQFERYVQVD